MEQIVTFLRTVTILCPLSTSTILLDSHDQTPTTPTPEKKSVSFAIQCCHFIIAVEIKKPLEEYVARHFPKGLIRVLRNTERKGLIAARLQGWRVAKGQVVSFFDSHMEVNDNWSVFWYRSLRIEFILL